MLRRRASGLHSTKDTIVAEIDPKLFLEDPFHIDFRDDSKAPMFQGILVRRKASSNPTSKVLLK